MRQPAGNIFLELSVIGNAEILAEGLVVAAKHLDKTLLFIDSPAIVVDARIK